MRQPKFVMIVAMVCVVAGAVLIFKNKSSPAAAPKTQRPSQPQTGRPSEAAEVLKVEGGFPITIDFNKVFYMKASKRNPPKVSAKLKDPDGAIARVFDDLAVTRKNDQFEVPLELSFEVTRRGAWRIQMYVDDKEVDFGWPIKVGPASP